jgi:hypothetical protein
MPSRKADAAVVAARVAAREQQDAKNRLQAEELARRKLARPKLEKKAGKKVLGTRSVGVAHAPSRTRAQCAFSYSSTRCARTAA